MKPRTQLDRIEWMLTRLLLLQPYFDLLQEMEDAEFAWSSQALIDEQRRGRAIQRVTFTNAAGGPNTGRGVHP